MWRPATPVRLVLFDAFDTLVQPTSPPFKQYADEANRAGLEVSDDNVAKAFKQAFRTLSASHPNYGLDTSLSSPDEWWRLVICSTFSPSFHPPPHSITPSQYTTLVPGLAHTLVHRFGTRAAYRLFPDVDETLSTLSSRGIKLGLATNSDSRILNVLHDFGVGRYVDLDSRHAQYNEIRGGGPTLSYFERAQKPHRDLFHAAMRRNGMTRAEQVLYVGDQLHKDFWGAKDAGLEACWLDRQGERHQPSSTNDMPRESHEEQEVLKARTIRDLRELIDIVA